MTTEERVRNLEREVRWTRVVGALAVLALACVVLVGATPQQDGNKKTEPAGIEIDQPFEAVRSALKELCRSEKRRELDTKFVPFDLTLYGVGHDDREENRFVLRFRLARQIARDYRELHERGMGHVSRHVVVTIVPVEGANRTRAMIQVTERKFYDGLGLLRGRRKVVDDSVLRKHLLGWLSFQVGLFADAPKK